MSHGSVWTFLLFLTAALLGALYLVLGIPLRNARAEWREGNHQEALTILHQWSRLRLRPAEFQQTMAVVLLTSGKLEEARPLLRRLAPRRPDIFPAIRKEEVAQMLVAKGRYRELLEYDAAIHERLEGDDVALYRAASQLGLGQIQEAQNSFTAVDQSEVDGAKYTALRDSIATWRRGSVPLIVDATGKTIAAWQVDNRDLVAVNSDFTSLVDSSAGALTIEAALQKEGTSTTIETTLDAAIQKEAVAVLSGIRGSIVVIDTKTSELLAVANSAGDGPVGNLAFTGRYEPGSVIKVLTGLNAVQSGINLGKVLPLDCNGFFLLSGRQFFDWAKHKKVSDLNEALAVSCNIAFARMGLELGAERSKQFMKSAGFDDTVDLDILQVPLGTTTGDIAIAPEYALATYSVGLVYPKVNALHLAMIANMVANGGLFTTPRLVRGQRTILGEPAAPVPPLQQTRICSIEAAGRVAKAMAAVVTNPRGTGRRAGLEGLPIAMKTGTAGDAANGYDSVIIAFAPAGAPRIAIGLVAEDIGPAELAGAVIAREFFARISSRVKSE